MKGLFNSRFWLFISLLWGVIASVAIFLHTTRAGDQLHYLGVAWEMWRQHHYLTPLASGVINLRKPPLYYWLILFGWHLFGPTAHWPIFLNYATAFAILILTWDLARNLYPKDNYSLLTWKHPFKENKIAPIATLILFSSLGFILFANKIRFDLLLTLFILLTFKGLLMSLQERRAGYAIFAASLGLGLLSKGPVIFIYILPLLLWVSAQKKVLLNLGIATLASFIIPGLWLLWVIHNYSYEFVMRLIFPQFAQALSGHPYQHSYKMLWYLFQGLLPWTMFYPLWTALFKKLQAPLDQSTKYLLINIIAVLGFFAFFVTLKRSRYLLPLYPLISILFAQVLHEYKKIIIIAAAGYIIALSYLLIFEPYFKAYFSLRPIAEKIHMLEQSGAQVVLLRDNLGWQNFEFYGQLPHALPMLTPSELKRWAKHYPNTLLAVGLNKNPKHCGKPMTIQRRFPNRYIVILPLRTYLAHCTA